jgi:hypothetical protein
MALTNDHPKSKLFKFSRWKSCLDGPILVGSTSLAVLVQIITFVLGRCLVKLLIDTVRVLLLTLGFRFLLFFTENSNLNVTNLLSQIIFANEIFTVAISEVLSSDLFTVL